MFGSKQAAHNGTELNCVTIPKVQSPTLEVTSAPCADDDQKDKSSLLPKPPTYSTNHESTEKVFTKISIYRFFMHKMRSELWDVRVFSGPRDRGGGAVGAAALLPKMKGVAGIML